jgi:hypothetical protein
MAKAKAKTTEMSPGLQAFAAASAAEDTMTNVADTAAPAASSTSVPDVPQGKHEFNPPIKSDAQVLAEAKAEREAKDAAAREQKKADKEAKDKEKADAKAKKEAEKAEKAAAKAKEQADKKAAREAASAERKARLAEAAEGKVYQGSMVALADRVKQGAYVKGTNGQLRSDDELARALDGVSVTDVIRIGLDLLKLEDNPYAALNVGQQSMNLRNRMRGAIKKEVIKISDIADYIARNNIHVVTAEAVAKAKAEREAKAAAAKAEKEAKAEAARKAAAEQAPVTPTDAAPAPAPEQAEGEQAAA